MSNWSDRVKAPRELVTGRRTPLFWGVFFVLAMSWLVVHYLMPYYRVTAGFLVTTALLQLIGGLLIFFGCDIAAGAHVMLKSDRKEVKRNREFGTMIVGGGLVALGAYLIWPTLLVVHNNHVLKLTSISFSVGVRSVDDVVLCGWLTLIGWATLYLCLSIWHLLRRNRSRPSSG